MEHKKHILLTGANGMLGRAILRVANQLNAPLVFHAPSRTDCDLCNADEVKELFGNQPFDAVIHAAARVGGIQANIDHPVEFLYENTVMNMNVIWAAAGQRVEHFVFVGSSCIYPKDYKNPLKEEYLLQAPLEPTNEGYAIGKIAGAKLCQYISETTPLAYRTVIPCNLYGPDDDFSSNKSHLIPAIIQKTQNAIAHQSESIDIWGDGQARREFLYIDDLARFMIENLRCLSDWPQYLNLGAGKDHTVKEYYQAVASVMGYQGSFAHDLSKPVGMKQKLLDSRRAMDHGWSPATPLQEGIRRTVENFIAHQTP